MAINPGASGGGLFNLEGKLIGINTWHLLDSKDVLDSMNFSVPTDVILTKFKDYIDNYEE